MRNAKDMTYPYPCGCIADEYGSLIHVCAGHVDKVAWEQAWQEIADECRGEWVTYPQRANQTTPSNAPKSGATSETVMLSWVLWYLFGVWCFVVGVAVGKWCL